MLETVYSARQIPTPVISEHVTAILAAWARKLIVPKRDVNCVHLGSTPTAKDLASCVPLERFRLALAQ